ncbi:MAG: RNA-binding protein [Nitrospirota bacterium]|nr:RNA-binding protein [Nitrospirota bacterium]MDH5769360.1 RNA-binding protein [Nitrospirota bacterium]
MGKKLYVGNISFNAKEGDIRELFSRIGEVESVKIITDARTGMPKGFGFVEMSSEEDAKKAIADLNGTTFIERVLSVSEARPQQPRQGFQDRRGGFGGGKGPRKGWR